MGKGDHYGSKTLLWCSQEKCNNVSPLYTAGHVCDHELQSQRIFTVLHVFAQCFKASGDCLCHTVASCIEIPPLHFTVSLY